MPNAYVRSYDDGYLAHILVLTSFESLEPSSQLFQFLLLRDISQETFYPENDDAFFTLLRKWEEVQDVNVFISIKYAGTSALYYSVGKWYGSQCRWPIIKTTRVDSQCQLTSASEYSLAYVGDELMSCL